MGNEIAALDVPGNVKFIDAVAFRGNDIATLTLHDGIEVIGGSAFARNNLTEIVIPATVTTINNGAFADNPALATVTIEGADPQRFNANWTAIGFPADQMP